MKLILPIEFGAELKERLPQDIEVAWADTHGNFIGDPEDAEAYFNWFYLKPDTLHRVLAAAPVLQWHQTPSSGVNHILTPTYRQRGIVLTNGAGTFSTPIAELVMAYILDRAKALAALHELQTQRQWKRRTELAFQDVAGATLLIVGAGSIGQAIAQRAKAFDMTVWGSRRRPQALPNFDQILGPEEWRSHLPKADYVVIATPLTPDTKDLFDEATLRAMAPHSYLINIARGAVIDEAALLRALQENWIAGAALDTFAVEPLPTDHPFWSLPNVFVTPHCSGLSPRNAERTIDLFLDNLNRYRNGQTLRNVVDQTVGY